MTNGGIVMEEQKNKNKLNLSYPLLSPLCGMVASLLMLGSWVKAEVFSFDMSISSLTSTAVLKGTGWILGWLPVPAIISNLFSNLGNITFLLVVMAVVFFACHCRYIFKVIVKKQPLGKGCVVLGSVILLFSTAFLKIIHSNAIFKVTPLPYLCAGLAMLEIFFALYSKKKG